MSNYTKVNHGFLVDGRVLIQGQDEINISQYIQNVMVRKRFISDYFPLFTVNLLLTKNLRDQLRDNDFQLYLRISYYNIDDTNGIESEDGTHNTEIGKIFDGIIRIYEKPFTTTAARKDSDSDETDAESRDSLVIIPYTISGIPEKLIAKNETIVNNVYRDCTLTDAIINQLTSIDKESTIHMQELTNKFVQDFVLFPPLNLIPALEFVDDKYRHFYRHDFNLFFDGNDTYFYDPIAEENSLNGNIFECEILDPNATADSDTAQNVMMDDKNNMKIRYKTAPIFATNKEIATHTLGSHTITYYYDDNFQLVTKTKDNSEAFNKIRYLWGRMSDYSYEVNDLSTSVTLSINNINPELFTPITTIRAVSSEYKNIVGDYSISELSYILSTSDHKTYSGSVSLLGLKRL